MPTVTAVVLAYGAEPWLEDAVHAVLTSAGVDIDVVVVDNGCTSDAIDRVKGRGGVRVISPEVNSGYSGGCDLGAAEASGEYLAFVNSDAIVSPAALARLAGVASEPEVGLAMGSIRLADSPDTMNTAGNPVHFTGLSWAGGFNEPADPVRAAPPGHRRIGMLLRHPPGALGRPGRLRPRVFRISRGHRDQPATVAARPERRIRSRCRRPAPL